MNRKDISQLNDNSFLWEGAGNKTSMVSLPFKNKTKVHIVFFSLVSLFTFWYFHCDCIITTN